MIGLVLLVILFIAIAFAGMKRDREAADRGRSIRTPLFATRGCGYAFVILLVLLFLGIWWAPNPGGIRQVPESAAMQTTRTLALAMFQYANDNNGVYPDGKSSTEVFQQLMDGNYITDPAILYIPMRGKTRGTVGAKLRPENVCYDVTSGLNLNSPDQLPAVFLTGFRIEYKPDGSAISLTKPAPEFKDHLEAWFFWQYSPFPGIAVAYHSNNAYFRTNGPGLDPWPTIDPDKILVVQHVVDASFDPEGKVYRQLTPEGPLK